MQKAMKFEYHVAFIFRMMRARHRSRKFYSRNRSFVGIHTEVGVSYYKEYQETVWRGAKGIGKQGVQDE